MESPFLVWFLRLLYGWWVVCFLWWLWGLHPAVLLAALILVAWGGFAWWREQRRRGTEGYWITTLGPGQIRDEPDDWALEYHEGGRQFHLMGKLNTKGRCDILYVSSEVAWDEAVPEWAWGRRDLILRRVESFLRDNRGLRNVRLVER